MSEKIEKEIVEKVEEVKKPEKKDTKPIEKFYTQKDVDILLKQNEEKFEALNKKVFKQETIEVARSLNINPTKVEAVMKLGDIEYGSENIKEKMAKVVEEHPAFRKVEKETPIKAKTEVEINTDNMFEVFANKHINKN